MLFLPLQALSRLLIFLSLSVWHLKGHSVRAVIPGSIEIKGGTRAQKRCLLRNLKITEAGDLESTKFYYLFIKNQ